MINTQHLFEDFLASLFFLPWKHGFFEAVLVGQNQPVVWAVQVSMNEQTIMYMKYVM
jgi:hypothetical protein